VAHNIAIDPIAANVTIVTTNRAKIVFSYKKPVGVFLFEQGKGYRMKDAQTVTSRKHINTHCREWEDVDPAQFDALLELV
jgi:hypothetical protein